MPDLTVSSPPDPDVDLARRLAEEAGQLLLALRARGHLRDRALGDAGDRDANDFLLRALAAERPGDAVLSEEAHDDHVRLSARRVWIVDPLDGTREYREGRDDWAVHVALATDGVVTAAAVSQPARSDVFDSRPSALAAMAARRIVISRSRPPAFANAIARALDAELAQVGSAGAKALAVVRGEALAYVHEGGMNEWDAAAPVGVALAHGLHVSDLSGRPLTFNRRDVVLHAGLVICRRELATTLLDAL